MNNYQDKRRSHKRLLLARNGRFRYVSAEDMAELTGIAIRTARRYRADPARMPPWIRELLELKALGLIPGFGGAFVEDGVLHLPDGPRFTPERLQALTFVYQELAELRRQVKRERKKNARLQHYLDAYRANVGEPLAVNDADY